MNDLNTKAIRERAERATGGEWQVENEDRPGCASVIIGTYEPGPTWIAGSFSPADAIFIARARTDVPLLCDALDAARAELAQAKQERDEREKALAFLRPRIAEIADESAQAKRERSMLRDALNDVTELVDEVQEEAAKEGDVIPGLELASEKGHAALDGTKETA